jgi:hypothetical protein
MEDELRLSGTGRPRNLPYLLRRIAAKIQPIRQGWAGSG